MRVLAFLPCRSCYSSSYFLFLIVLILCRCYLSLENSDKLLCFERERAALLQFKRELVGGGSRLNSWEGEKDCCKWAGIVCDNNSGHVQQIHLLGARCGEMDGEILGGKISPSLQHLEQLEYLDLSCNDFFGIKIPGFIGSLRNLKYLNISLSDFSGEIPHQLGNLSKLHVLSLAYNRYDLRAKNMQWLSALSMLQHLDLRDVYLRKASDWLQVINTLPSLVELYLGLCFLPSPLPLTSVNLTSLSVLDLHANFFVNATVPGWIFNITSLVSLDLSYCSFQAPISRSSYGFHKMTSLQRFDVSGNDFMKSSWFLKGLSSVGSTLVSLEMRGCDLSSPILNALRNLSSLVRLDLAENNLNQTVPESLGNLCNLKQIDLSGNDFGSISLSEVLHSFFKCESLKLESLLISFSNVSGHLPNQIEQLDKLANLEVLDLSRNLFSGAIPDFIGVLTSLKQLDVSSNHLNGSIPESIGQLFNLEYLSIGNNLLTGVVTENHFTNLTRLKHFLANGNIQTLQPHLANWVPPFQLTRLELRSWSFGPQFPSWLQSQTELKDLDISSLRIPYSIPEWFWSTSSRLRYLNLSHNEIHGKLVARIPASFVFLDLHSINYSGPSPGLTNNSEIAFLDLSKSSFSGSLKHLLCPVAHTYQVDLRFLFLADNHLSGVIPNCWTQWKSLLVLDLENNNLSGGIPKSLRYLSNGLTLLNMRNNKLSGHLPASLANLTNLRILQLGGNEFTGTIPTWIAGLTSLRLLDLRSNKFVGNIPHQLCNVTSIQILDLAHNNFTGVIPSCFSNFSIMSGTESFPQSIMTFFVYNDLDIKGSASLVVKGREDIYSNNLGLMTLLDFSSNSFSGHIPTDLTSLVKLHSLNLSINHLTGRIPGNIGDMKMLESLDLSINQLDGEVPASFSSLTFLSQLNLSYNLLTGSIPKSTQIQSLDNSSFIGNRLCGPPLIKRCGVATPNDSVGGEFVKEGSNGSNGKDWGLIISIVLGFAVGFWVVVGPLMISRSWRIFYFHALDKVRFGIYDVVVNTFHKMF